MTKFANFDGILVPKSLRNTPKYLIQIGLIASILNPFFVLPKPANAQVAGTNGREIMMNINAQQAVQNSDTDNSPRDNVIKPLQVSETPKIEQDLGRDSTAFDEANFPQDPTIKTSQTGEESSKVTGPTLSQGYNEPKPYKNKNQEQLPISELIDKESNVGAIPIENPINDVPIGNLDNTQPDPEPPLNNGIERQKIAKKISPVSKPETINSIETATNKEIPKQYFIQERINSQPIKNNKDGQRLVTQVPITNFNVPTIRVLPELESLLNFSEVLRSSLSNIENFRSIIVPNLSFIQPQYRGKEISDRQEFYNLLSDIINISPESEVNDRLTSFFSSSVITFNPADNPNNIATNNAFNSKSFAIYPDESETGITEYGKKIIESYSINPRSLEERKIEQAKISKPKPKPKPITRVTSDNFKNTNTHFNLFAPVTLGLIGFGGILTIFLRKKNKQKPRLNNYKIPNYYQHAVDVQTTTVIDAGDEIPDINQIYSNLRKSKYKDKLIFEDFCYNLTNLSTLDKDEKNETRKFVYYFAQLIGLNVYKIFEKAKENGIDSINEESRKRISVIGNKIKYAFIKGDFSDEIFSKLDEEKFKLFLDYLSKQDFKKTTQPV
jgi:hypothetical protein